MSSMSDEFAGPISYLVTVLPREADAGPALLSLLEQVEARGIELLDLEILARGESGTAERQSIETLRHDESIDVSDFEGAESDLLDDEDLRELGAELGDDEIALVIVYVDRSLAQFAARVSEAGGRELWLGGIELGDLDPSLTEDAESVENEEAAS